MDFQNHRDQNRESEVGLQWEKDSLIKFPKDDRETHIFFK